MWHYLIYLTVFGTSAKAFSVYQPLDCINDYHGCQQCAPINLGCAPAQCLPAPLPCPAPTPPVSCVPVSSPANPNFTTIMTILAALQKTGVVGAPVIPSNGTSANCVPVDKVLQILAINCPNITLAYLVSNGILPPTTSPFLLTLTLADILKLNVLPIGNSNSSLLGGLLGGGNGQSLIDLSLLNGNNGLLGTGLLGGNGLLGGVGSLLSNLLGLGGAPATPAGPGVSQQQINTLLLQLLTSLATSNSPGCPAGTIAVAQPTCQRVC